MNGSLWELMDAPSGGQEKELHLHVNEWEEYQGHGHCVLQNLSPF